MIKMATIFWLSFFFVWEQQLIHTHQLLATSKWHDYIMPEKCETGAVVKFLGMCISVFPFTDVEQKIIKKTWCVYAPYLLSMWKKSSDKLNHKVRSEMECPNF